MVNASTKNSADPTPGLTSPRPTGPGSTPGTGGPAGVFYPPNPEVTDKTTDNGPFTEGPSTP